MSWMVRRNPLVDLRMMQDELNRFFNANLPQFSGSEEGLVRGSWSPNVDIYEDQDSIVLEADMPGMKPGDFNLSIENFQLTLSGERKFEREDKRESFHRIERNYGSFTRVFSLPTTVKVDEVNAEFRDGVLRISLPKREEVRARQIEIAVNTETGGGKAKTADVK